jgi:uncharacterized protein (TIGR02265 family)
MALDPRIAGLVAHTDLEERLRLVPPSASLRGLYFKNTVAVLRSAGLLAQYQELYPEAHSAVRFYPIADFLERAAVAAALLRGPEHVDGGLREIGRRNVLAFSESLIGRTALRLLAPEPVTLLRQACAGRRQSCRYGRWEVTFPERGMAVMHMFEEYLWIESNVLGAAEGTMEAIGRTVTVQVELDSKFKGRHILRWKE